MAIPRWLVRPLCWSLALLLVGIAGWYSPLLTAVGWHLFHPSGKVDYRGLHVSVPWPWTADTQYDPEEGAAGAEAAAPRGILLKREPFTFARREPAETIFVTVISPDPGISAQRQTDEWIDSFRATHRRASFSDNAGQVNPAGAVCLSAWQPGDTRDVVWTCVSGRDGWVANFEGHASDAATFFSTVAGLKR